MIDRRTLMAGALVASTACGWADTGTTRQSVTLVPTVTFLHAGFDAGPTVFTDASGVVVEERRQEPFGAMIDHADLVARDLNPFNKRSEAATGWSDHGARWLVPDTARWLTPDPPVEAPDASYMLAPWGLHPYQYVNQNPVTYWDPEGLSPFEAWQLGLTDPPNTGENLSAAGTIAIGAGAGAVARIPVPGTDGLAIELSPRNYKGVSTSSVFIQSENGKVHLRLDWGYNKNTGNIDYHWNQQGTFNKFGVYNHSVADGGEALWHAARTFKWVGRGLFVAGAVADIVSIVQAKDRVRQSVVVGAGFAGAWAGAKFLGGLGAAGGTAIEPGGGTFVGGAGGAIVGGIAGGLGMRWVAGKVYDRIWEPLEEVKR